MARGRRGAQEGSIFQRKDGRWVGSLNLGWENGQRKRRHFYAATAAEVRDQLLKARSDQSQGLPVATERQTVAQFLESWLKLTLKIRAKPRSFESFTSIVNKHIVPEVGRIRVDKLTPQHVQALLEKKRQPYKKKPRTGKTIEKSGLGPQSIANIRTVLRSALAQALKWGIVARNVATLVDPPRIPRPKTHAIDVEGVRKLLEVAHGERFEAILVLAVTLGLRRGEILGLRWSDVDFETRAIRVNQALQRVGGKLQITEVKTERSRRVVAIPESVIRALKTRRAQQAQERLLAGLKWKDSELTFTNPTGGPLEPITLHRDFKQLLRTAELSTETRFHDLRHTAASLLLAEGVHLRMIMELLGHSSISLTANTYAHVMPAAMRDVADKMETILGSHVAR
jgi:integrase